MLLRQIVTHLLKALDLQIPYHYLGKPQKKVILLMAGPLRPYPPPPSALMAIKLFILVIK